MRRKTLANMLKVIHGQRFDPSPDQREMVTLLVFGESPPERIAEHIGCSMDELRYHFHRELNLSKEQLLACFTKNVFQLANQRDDLGVAMRANEFILRPTKVFRVPKDEPAPPIAPVERIESLTEAEVDREISRLRGLAGRAGLSAEPADAQEAPDRPADEADDLV